ncbi:MAG: alpha/beta hydrolase [Candidatus Tectomicrobia bacterium]|nr:alpha/beta hydrolase [Candidatus Tectomicrobia bacterium]
MGLFVLIHSPLVGPLTWSLVADELQRRGIQVVVPTLFTDPKVGPPYWKQHVNAVARALEPVSLDQPLILVGHSGAGVLLPAIRQTTDRLVAAYVLVDADIPKNGASRLDLFEPPEAADQFRQTASNGFLPIWSEDALRQVIEDVGLRQRFVTELRPLPLAVYEEPIPVFNSWPDASCGYMRFTSTSSYEGSGRQAQRKGWTYVEIEGRHFHMLVGPRTVAHALVNLAERMGIAASKK